MDDSGDGLEWIDDVLKLRAFRAAAVAEVPGVLRGGWWRTHLSGRAAGVQPPGAAGFRSRSGPRSVLTIRRERNRWPAPKPCRPYALGRAFHVQKKKEFSVGKTTELLALRASWVNMTVRVCGRTTAAR